MNIILSELNQRVYFIKRQHLDYIGRLYFIYFIRGIRVMKWGGTLCVRSLGSIEYQSPIVECEVNLPLCELEYTIVS